MSEMRCKQHGTALTSIPCPDGKPGCLVAHFECRECRAGRESVGTDQRAMLMESRFNPSFLAWLRVHAKRNGWTYEYALGLASSLEDASEALATRTAAR